jgi:ferric-dicitrate binding protein FerR (iron transport regulator)
MTHYPLHNKIDTARAWEHLYARLQQDELIPAKATERSRWRVHLPVASRWVAAVLALCMGMAAVALLNRKDKAVDTSRLSLHNERGAVTLVTTLDDGSIVYLADDTRLEYPEHFLSDKREVALKGQALFNVSGNSERPFLIETELTLIEVVGTAFDVQSSDAVPFTLSVQQGEVKVTLKKNGQTLNVKNGETARLVSGRLQVGQTTDRGVFNRYTERLRFKSEKLANILRVINHLGGDVELQTTPVLENKKITVTFAGDDTPESIAELICIAFNFRCNKHENNILMISEP